MRGRGVVALLALTVVFASSAASQVVVVCTTTIVGDVVEHVAGADAVVTTLLSPGEDPHAVQATPRHALALERADAVFLSGAGLETWVQPLVEAIPARVVDLSAGLAVRMQAGSASAAEADPHVWLDPWNVMEWVRAVARTLADLDPEHADGYAARAAAYEAELAALDGWIRDRVASLSTDRRRLVTDHESWSYFAARYGFAELGSVLPGSSTLAEASARELAALEDAIRAAGVPAIFVDTALSTTLVDQVAADTGTRVVFLYTESLSQGTGPAASYLDLMKFDVETIVESLRGAS